MKGDNILSKSKNNMTKRQHYVPKFYLHYYTDDNDKIYVFDCEKNRTFQSQPKDICRMDYLYESEWENADSRLGKHILPNSIEKSYSRLESKAANVCNKIIKRCNLYSHRIHGVCSRKEKKILLNFIVNLVLRNPYTMEMNNIDDISDLEGNDEIDMYIKLLDGMGWHGGESFIRAASRWCNLNVESKYSLQRLFFDEIKDLNYVFLKSDKPLFIASDFPVVLGTDHSIEDNNKIMMGFPVSPHIYMLIGNYEHLKKYCNYLIPVEESVVMKIVKNYIESNQSKCRFLMSNSSEILENIIKWRL